MPPCTGFDGHMGGSCAGFMSAQAASRPCCLRRTTMTAHLEQCPQQLVAVLLVALEQVACRDIQQRGSQRSCHSMHQLCLPTARGSIQQQAPAQTKGRLLVSECCVRQQLIVCGLHWARPARVPLQYSKTSVEGDSQPCLLVYRGISF